MDGMNNVSFSTIKDSWNEPLVSIIISHHNYSHMLRDALQSICEQSYNNWECIVVDDGSILDHREKARKTIENFDSHRIRFVELDKNIGQIPAFFHAFDRSHGDFVCLLDPDDRYAETFIEESVRAHLNQTVVCPILCTDQFTVTDNGINTACYMWHKQALLKSAGLGFLIGDDRAHTIWIKPEQIGFFWSSTSAMMFRRAAVEFVRPHKPLNYKGSADTYLGCGIHLLGGSLVLTKPLVYRMLHADNTFIQRDIYASLQDKKRSDFRSDAAECRRDSYEALLHNKAPGITDDMIYLIYDRPISRDVRWPRHSLHKWRRSFRKRKRVWDKYWGTEAHPFLPAGYVIDNERPFH